MKKILILGGTQFVGRNLVERLDALGQFEITLFNRQQTGSHLFSHLKKIKGDRETSDINQLKNKTWDAVIDLSAYYPNSLQNLLEIMKLCLVLCPKPPTPVCQPMETANPNASECLEMQHI